jgi:hypothetical protein
LHRDVILTLLLRQNESHDVGVFPLSLGAVASLTEPKYFDQRWSKGIFTDSQEKVAFLMLNAG